MESVRSIEDLSKRGFDIDAGIAMCAGDEEVYVEVLDAAREEGKEKIPLIRELYGKMRAQRLRPKTIVDYTREPFVYGPGNVRVTLDYNIRTGLSCTDFLNAACPTVPVPENPAILEVKWDAFLPDVVREAVQLPGRHVGAFSKYAACRSYD